MSEAIWQQGVVTKDWFGDYKGLAVRITIEPLGRPTKISWFVNGRLVKALPVRCSLAQAKAMAQTVIDRRIEAGIWSSERNERIAKYGRQ